MKYYLNQMVFFITVFFLIGINYISFAYKAFIPGFALILGMTLTTFYHDPLIRKHTQIWSTKVLSYAIILLGFGFHLDLILKAGLSGLSYTLVSIACTLVLGLLLGRVLNNEGKISTLISSGTAICGGSAIAAIAPIIRASHEQTAVAMGVVFLLNAVGLILFPVLGHYLHLSQHQFGLLAALAIHDTSSVVGSCMSYGEESLMVGTTVKLVRALWIIPVSLLIAFVFHHIKNTEETGAVKTKKPWFLLWFICASLSVTLIPGLDGMGMVLKHFGESVFMVALFLIGYNVSIKNLKTVGLKVLIQAIVLWITVSLVVIWALKTGILN